MKAKRATGFLRPTVTNLGGDPAFWSLVRRICADNRRRGQRFIDDDQFARMRAVADASPVGLPKWVWAALVSQQHERDEAAALGIDGAQRVRDQDARHAWQAQRESAAERTLPQRTKSSSGRTRIAT